METKIDSGLQIPTKGHHIFSTEVSDCKNVHF